MRYLEIVLTFLLVFVYVEVGRQYAHSRLRVWMEAYQRRHTRFATTELAESFASWIHFPSDSYYGTLGVYDAAPFAYVRDVVYVWEARGADRQMRLQLMQRYIAVVQWLWLLLLGISLLQITGFIAQSVMSELREHRLPHRRLVNYLSRLRRAHRRRMRELGRI
ncbi:MAG: hypothetical protein QG626_373 [Patescibacteria group bacterium]|nr:hypothetical protein [Patescibacteria group bacterium]